MVCPIPIAPPDADGSAGSTIVEGPSKTPNILKPLFSMPGVTVLDPLHERQELLRNKRPQAVEIFWGRANSWVESIGRHPSRGWLLVTGDSLKNLPASPSQTLTITDGVGRSYSRGGLVTTDRTAVTADYKTANGVSPDAAYLVELSDSRYYAPWCSAFAEYNVRDAYCIAHRTNGEQGLGTLTWGAVLWHFWHAHGLSNLMGPLALDRRALIPYLAPETIRWNGVNCWEAFHRMLDHLGWQLAPTVNSTRAAYILRTGSSTPSDRDLRRFTDAKSTALEDCEGEGHPTSLPEKIRVYLPTRDYQWQTYFDRSGTKTAQDVWEMTPTRFFDVPSSEVLEETPSTPELPAPEIIPNTLKTVWGTIPLITNDRGEVFEKAKVEQHVRSLAINTLAGMKRFYRFGSYTFLGLWPMETGPLWSRIVYYDLGDGLRTRYLSRPQSTDPTPDTLTGSLQQLHKDDFDTWQTPPDLSNHSPIPRNIYGLVWGTDQQQQKFKCHDRPITAGQIKPGISPGHWGWVAVLFANIDYESGFETWGNAGFVPAFNATDVTVTFGVRVQLDYNYQAGACGEWHIVVVHRTGPDVQQDCVTTGTAEQPPDRRRAVGPDLITLNRRSSLRMGLRRDQQQNPLLCEALVEIAPGPQNTLLHSLRPSREPRWVADGAIRGSFKIGTYLRFAGQQVSNQSDRVESWVGPPSEGDIKLRLPAHQTPKQSNTDTLNSEGAKTGAYLIAGPVNKECVQSQWFGPGLNAVLSFNYAFVGEGCLGSAQCVSLVYENGLLVEIVGHEGQKPKPNKDVVCVDIYEPDFDPCSLQPAPYPGKFRPIPTQGPPDDPDEDDDDDTPSDDDPDDQQPPGENENPPELGHCIQDGAGIITCFDEDGNVIPKPRQPGDPPFRLLGVGTRVKPTLPTDPTKPLPPTP